MCEGRDSTTKSLLTHPPGTSGCDGFDRASSTGCPGLSVTQGEARCGLQRWEHIVYGMFSIMRKIATHTQVIT